ncbi:MAG TPA: M3 family metallopeptidase [Nocardioidaceae bacterium]|nr:M3 family metallopeptidase [Nocardioidaceae bacterium]
MASDLPPLALPAADWEEWLGERCDGQLDEARRLRAVLTGPPSGGRDALAVWNDLILALRNAFSAASLMANVHPEQAVRARAERAEQDASRLQTEIGLDRGVYDVLAGVDPAGLDADAERMLALTLRDFRRAGVDRDEPVRSRLRELAERETAVEQEFSRNIRDDVRRVRVPATALDGLPADFVEGHPADDDGLVEITTDYPDYVPFTTFCRDREARAALVREFLNRAYPANDRLLHDLLELRREHAQLLGYDGWPAFDAEVKMIGGGPAIPAFVDRITEASGASARRDVDVLLRRVQQDHPDVGVVDTVDKAFYSEVLRRERFEVDAQQVRAYFGFAAVRRGLLEVTGRLFDLDYVEVTDGASWHPDVATYDVVRDGRRLGRIHLDLHPRAGKYGHAAQFDLAPGIAGRQLAEGVLVCNFSRALMEHSHVVTLFHEFGHLLHHVLGGDQKWTRFSGVATEWDFVEAPSQMLEEWAWDPDVLQSFAKDADGRPIPRELVERMRAASEFGKGTYVRTQMFYAALSYRLHQDVPDDFVAVLRELQETYDVFGYVPDTHFYASFGHLQGYGSGYYTYMWSLVIAKDLFSAFDRENLFDTEVAHRYRDRILAPGGSKDAEDLVADFLGRPYDATAFQRWLDA